MTSQKHGEELFSKRLIYFKGKVTDMERDKQRSFIHWFTATARVGPETRRWKLLLGLSHGCEGPRSWVIFHCFPRGISKELDF